MNTWFTGRSPTSRVSQNIAVGSLAMSLCLMLVLSILPFGSYGQSANVADVPQTAWGEPILIDDGLVDPATGDGYVAMVALSDFDRDGQTDAVVAAQSMNTLFWYARRGSKWEREVIESQLSSPHAVFIANMDADEDQDVLVAFAGETEVIAWYENVRDVSGSGWPEVEINWKRRVINDSGLLCGTGDIHAADIDGDGDVDVVAQGSDSHNIVWFEQDDGNWNPRTIDGDAGNASMIDVADLDRDGDLDILATSSTHNNIVWYEQRDVTERGWPAEFVIWVRHSIDADRPGAAGIHCGDVDLDGDIDVVANSFSDHAVVLYRNEGMMFTPVVLSVSIEGHSAGIMMNDIDQDGDLDILSAGDDLILFENGVAGWTERPLAPQIREISFLAVADVDGLPEDDGTYDLDIVGSTASGQLFLLEQESLTISSTRRDEVPAVFALHQNYPNPFNPSTRISYDLPETATPALTVFDVLGRVVAEVSLDSTPPGHHEILFDAADLTSGLYVYRLAAGNSSQTRRMVVLK